MPRNTIVRLNKQTAEKDKKPLSTENKKKPAPAGTNKKPASPGNKKLHPILQKAGNLLGYFTTPNINGSNDETKDTVDPFKTPPSTPNRFDPPGAPVKPALTK